MQLKQKCMFIIFGPTGAGKSDFALSIASKVPAEIINMDIGSFYTPLTIGTAKPDWRASKVPHHLFDIIDEPQNFSVTAYRERLLSVLNDVWQRGKLPILVGGSAFYLKSIFFPPELETSIQEYVYDMPEDQLWGKLNAIDSDRAASIHHHDTYRIKRALDIWQATGKKPSLYIPVYKPLAPFQLFFVTRDRDELYDSINKRVDVMVNQGLIEEVKNFVGTEWEQFLLKKKMIGYDDILHHFKGDHDLDYALKMVKQRSRNYAKRQETFWRMLKKQLLEVLEKHQSTPGEMASELHEVNLTLLDLDLYIKQLSKRLLMLF